MFGPFRVLVEAVGSEKIRGGAEEDAEAVSARRSNPLPFWSLGLEAFFDKPDQRHLPVTSVMLRPYIINNYHNGAIIMLMIVRRIMARVIMRI